MICSAPGHCSSPSINIPESAISGAGWNLLYFVGNSSFSGKKSSRNIMLLGNPSNWRNNDRFFFGPSLTTKQQKQIDKKIDDGMPFLGRITDMSGDNISFSPNCTDINSDNHSTPHAVYDLSYDGPACVLIVDIE